MDSKQEVKISDHQVANMSEIIETSLEESASTSTSFEEYTRACKNKRRQIDPSICPVCSCTLRTSEVDQHLNCELEKLQKVNVRSKQNGKCNSLSPTNTGPENGLYKQWETYQRVRNNRQGRQKSKGSRKKKEEIICPVCNKETSEEINVHVEKCLRQTNGDNGDSDDNIDVEGYEEYEWAGQSRVRVTSLLEGGVSNLGTSITMVDEDEDLVVDGDDSQTYGSAQYVEADIILHEDGHDLLRKAVVGSNNFKRKQTDDLKHDDYRNHSSSASSSGSSSDPVLEALKTRIRELETKECKEDIYKCLICMEKYKTPVISVCCWHVHCEECWLQTLGVKRLCPQCNMITSPADLRKIYM